tara:strand:+ start:492 stop:647 length:156 start_codon:yes stop_codon:yes gene_type:complete
VQKTSNNKDTREREERKRKRGREEERTEKVKVGHLKKKQNSRELEQGGSVK